MGDACSSTEARGARSVRIRPRTLRQASSAPGFAGKAGSGASSTGAVRTSTAVPAEAAPAGTRTGAAAAVTVALALATGVTEAAAVVELAVTLAVVLPDVPLAEEGADPWVGPVRVDVRGAG